MKKEIYITSYKNGMQLYSVYESHDKAIEYFNSDTQKLHKVLIEVPDPDETVEAEEIPIDYPPYQSN